MAHLPSKYPAKEDRRRANSHDVDKVGRWAAARWVPGGSTGVHQGGQRYVRPKEGGGVRTRNNGEGERGNERKPDELPRSLFSPLGDRSATGEGVEREKERDRIKSDVLENRRK